LATGNCGENEAVSYKPFLLRDYPRPVPKRVPSGLRALLFYFMLTSSVIGAGFAFDRLAHTGPAALDTHSALQADMARENASPEVRRVAHWAVDSNDHASLPFVIVDKTHARLFAFDGTGRFQGSTSVLLGSQRSDGEGAAITPAGRFSMDSWLSARSDGIVWVNGDTLLSLHGADAVVPPGRARQRLASAVVEDKRISDGSLHVAPEFYRQYLALLRSHASVVYVLPETRPVEQVFSLYGEVPPHALAQALRTSGNRRPS
jgi:hypothetical protein